MLGYVFSSDDIKYDVSADLTGALYLVYKNHILSMPRSGLSGKGKGEVMTKIFFDLIPLLNADANGGVSISMFSDDLSKSVRLEAGGNIALEGKLFGISLVGVKAELEKLNAVIYFNRPETESKGNIEASLHIVANLVFGIVTITDQKMKLNLNHLQKNNYKIYLYRDRFDGLSSATQEGDVYFTSTNGVTTIQSNTVYMTGRANVSNNCDRTLVNITGGNGIHIAPLTIACYSEGVIDMGYGRLQLWRTKWFDTSMDGLDLGF